MTSLPKEKRNQVIFVAMVTLLVLGGLIFLLIRYQYDVLTDLADKKQAAEKKNHDVENAVRRADQIEAELAGASARLATLEGAMATGDLYSWVINTVSQFQLSYKVDIPQFSSIQQGDVNLFVKFPYKQATLTVGGSACYHDLGKFVADFENEFPHVRVVDVEVQPASVPAAGDKEKLSFKMDIVTLVKPSSP